MFRAIACFLLGFILGVVAMNLFCAGKIDRSIKETNTLQTELNQLRNRLEKLESLESKPAEVIVNDIMPIVYYSGNKIETSPVEDYIIDAVGHLIGQPVKLVDPMLMIKIFDGRILTFNSNRCKLKVRYLVLAENLVLYIEILDHPSD